MSKSHAYELSEVYRCIFADAAVAFPTLETELSKDFSTLQKLAEQRGIHVYLVDLPAVGKHLDRCLNDGQYLSSGLPLTKRFTRGVVIPKFLRGLYLLVFNEFGCLRASYSIEAVFFLRQICYMAKKAPIDCSQSDVENEVLDFYQTDRSLPKPDGPWGESAGSSIQVWSIYHGYGKCPAYRDRLSAYGPANAGPRSRSPLEALDFVSSFIVQSLGSYDPLDWKFRHGPGAISETTSAACKYEGLRQNWDSFLEADFPISEYGFHNHLSWGKWLLTSRELGDPRVRGDERRLCSIEQSRVQLATIGPHSRMVAVPKSYDRPRLIAAEPVSRQYCQQNIWHYFRSRVEASWIAGFIAFSDQKLNQRLCIEGSKNNMLATVDLSSASDRVTCSAVGQFFRSNPRLLSALRATRTPVVQQYLSHRVPNLFALRKFSTMGNACTFPVESLIFLGCALASVLITRGLRYTARNVWRLQGEVAVFGDDIIIPNDSREQFERLLEVLHFKINSAKTFWSGNFRESCGIDSFRGVEVTPVYWKGAFNGRYGSLETTVATSNNFYKKFLMKTAEHVSSTLPRRIAQVATSSGAFGLQTRTDPFNGHLEMRVNERLQRVECLCEVVETSIERTRTGAESALLQYFTEAPSPFDKWEAGYNQRPKFRKKLRWVPLAELSAQEVQIGGEIVRLHLKASGSPELAVN